MKKLMFAGIAALCATVGVADGISSENIVGYQTYDASLTDDMSTIGVSFSNTSVAGGDYSITDTMFGRTVEDNDQILLWDNDAYNLIIYSYIDGLGWDLMDAYGDDQGIVPSITVSKGQVLWFLPADPANAISVSGTVAPSGTQTLTFEPGGAYGDCFAFVNPFPKDTLFSDLTDFCGDGDTFLLWDNQAYNLIIYSYIDGLGWDVLDAYGDDQGIADESAVAIPAGSGAYFLPADVREWTVTLNY